MRAKPMILIVIAVVCGLVASIGISQVMDANANRGGVQVPTEKIYVALDNIDAGTKLEEKHVKLEAWPKDKIPPGAIVKLEELKDKFPRTRFVKDEIILRDKISDRKGGFTDKIPEGFRVVPVKVSAETVTGLISPGDCVDVLAFMRKSADVPNTVTKTILSNIKVFSVGSETERTVEKDGKTSNVQTISLLVLPKQVQKILMAVELGRIQLSLRSDSDKDKDKGLNEKDDDGTNLSGLLGEEQRPEPVKPEVEVKPEVVAKTEPQPDFKAWIDTITSNAKPTNLPTVGSQDRPHIIEIHGPEGIRYFMWTNPNSPPREVTADEVKSESLAAQRLPSDALAFVGTNIDISGRTLQNSKLNWNKYRGKPVLLVFWATWCPTCRGEMPLVKSLHDGYADKGLEIVTVNFDQDPKFAAKYLVEHKVNWETIVGADAHQLSTRLAVKDVPTMLLIDADGRLNAVGNHISEMLPQVSLMYGALPQGSELRALLNPDNVKKDKSESTTGKEAPATEAPDATETADTVREPKDATEAQSTAATAEEPRSKRTSDKTKTTTKTKKNGPPTASE